MIDRQIRQQVDEYLDSKDNKIFFIWGPRRSGKTTILKQLEAELPAKRFNFDFQSDRDLFEPTREALGKIVSQQKIILIDEIQNYPESTRALKLLYDEFDVKIIATGSSELRQKAKKDFDTLAGRYTEHYCLPLSIEEIVTNAKIPAYEQASFENRLQDSLQIFGAYPEVYANDSLSISDKTELLNTILEAYVLKDVIDIYNLKNAKLARDILTKIALQIGQEVSMAEIANCLGANQTTVASYIEIFIKNYVLLPLQPFKTNIRRAVSENRKLYFYDMGIRNTLIKDFRELDLRQDKGSVFENFAVVELEKRRRNIKSDQSLYFYREYGGKEADVVLEDYQKNYTVVEIKRNLKKNPKDIFPIEHKFTILSSSNYFRVIQDSIR